MAQKVVTTYVDDTDGAEAAETVSFALDGVEWEIDLSEDNAAALREALEPWVEHARRVGGRRRSGAAKAKSNGVTATAASTSDIREWAQEAGYEVSARGRISAAVREAYDAAH